MEINLKKNFKDRDGKVLNAEKECCIQKANGDLATSKGDLVIVMVPTPELKLNLKAICIESLLADIPEDETDKYEKYQLFQKFHEADDKINLESKEVVLVQKLIEKCYGTLTYGQAFDMLEGK